MKIPHIHKKETKPTITPFLIVYNTADNTFKKFFFHTHSLGIDFRFCPKALFLSDIKLETDGL